MSYRFAIIGCGHIAQRHARQIAGYGKLLAVCDIVKQKADALAGAFGATPYYDAAQMLAAEQVDVVVICTPNGYHAEHAFLSLSAGNHVLCEKPMTLTTAAGKQMIEAADAAGKRLLVVKQNRYNPPVETVKKMLRHNQLGKLFSFQVNCFWNRPAAYYENSWHGTRELDGGILFTQFSHFIDLLYWFLGDVASVRGYSSNYVHQHLIEFEDTGVAILHMQNGAIGSLHYTVGAHQKNMEGSFTLFGEKGTLKIGGQYLNELDYFSVDGEAMPVLPGGKPANQYGMYEGSMSNHDKVYENLIRSLDNPAHEFVEAREALKSVEIIEKIYAASAFIK